MKYLPIHVESLEVGYTTVFMWLLTIEAAAFMIEAVMPLPRVFYMMIAAALTFYGAVATAALWSH